MTKWATLHKPSNHLATSNQQLIEIGHTAPFPKLPAYYNHSGNYSNSGEKRREREQGYYCIQYNKEEEEEEEEGEEGGEQCVKKEEEEGEEKEDEGMREGVRFSVMDWQKREWKVIDGVFSRQKESRQDPPRAPYFGSHRGGGKTNRRGDEERGGSREGGGGRGGEGGGGKGGGGRGGGRGVRRGGGGEGRRGRWAGSHHTQGVRGDRVCDEAVALLTQPWNIPEYSSDDSG